VDVELAVHVGRVQDGEVLRLPGVDGDLVEAAPPLFSATRNSWLSAETVALTGDDGSRETPQRRTSAAKQL
jgi:hypothetical protein